ncbi:MAG: diaminopimelate epimerase [Clostridia bacterium]|nr:diaminopimelate epimerase [Clostridia bacterium]
MDFTKMHGLGNDYIYIELLNDKNIIVKEDLPKLTRYLCNRHFGVGADGVILVSKSEIADFKMTIYNQDGSIAQMCGNGIRCFAKYVYEKGLTTNNIINIETDSGIKQAYLSLENNQVIEVTVCMGNPIVDIQKLKEVGFISDTINEKIKLSIDDMEIPVFPVSLGNPHVVIFVGKVDDFNVNKYGKMIENDKIFPQKTNVEFVQLIDRGHIKMRVWERGVGETYACGTGACAAAAVCIMKGYTRRHVTVNLKGGDLKINWSIQDNNMYMSGIATKVFDGKI